MKLQTAKIEQIATQLLAGMLANPEIYSLDPTVKIEVSKEQEEKLVLKAIAMAKTLVTKVETQIKHRDRILSPTRPMAIEPIPHKV